MSDRKFTLPGFLVMLLVMSTANATERVAVYVELQNPAPTVVARHKAQRADAHAPVFDEALHRAKMRLAQDALLSGLVSAAVPYEVTSSTIATGRAPVAREHRFTELINAVRLLVYPADIPKLLRLANVRNVSLEEQMRLTLNNSVAYIGGNGPAPSARALGITGAGTMNPDGSATGQVIAVLDTGIDHTNPMYDLTTPDGSRDATSSDTRPVRLTGQAYSDGTNHPKVAYRYLVAQAPFEGDDTGHGTNSSTTAGGLLATDSLGTGAAVEGVAPGAVMMDYKVCPSLACVAQQQLLALEDCIQPLDLAGFPKPVCTVVNMSFGSDAGNPNGAQAVVAGNLQFAGVVPVASAGNAGPAEQIVGSPSSNRRVISVAASNDPGVSPNSIDILAFDTDLRNNPGNDPAPATLPAEPGEPTFLSFIAPESNGAQALAGPVAQHYVDCGFCDTPDLVPVEANGRICLAIRGSTQDDPSGTSGTGLFSNKAAQCAAKGGIALLMYNNVPGQVGGVLAPAAIPVFTTGGDEGVYLKDTLGFDGNGISILPIRMNLADPGQFLPSTTGFSSRGPRPDFVNSVKPDIIAPGQDVLMGASKIGALGSPTGFTPADGTSFSGPHVAGAAALMRDALARPDFTPSQVRAALMNSATNLRDGSGNEIPDADDRNFIHELGAGLVDMVDAIQIGALMGTNEMNGSGGPDATTEPDFLPSYNFGVRGWIGTGVPGADPSQQAKITVTVSDVGGGGGLFDLAIVDGSGFPRGDVTRPITETGFSVSTSTNQVNVPPGGSVTFDVTVAVDGTGGGLQIAGNDVGGLPATEFLWYVKAAGVSEELRMPFYLRVVTGNAPSLLAVDDLAFTDPDVPVAIDVLLNDQGVGLGVSSVDNPPNGTATINDNGTPANPGDDFVDYTPDAGFIGVDTFDYDITDGTNFGSATITVSVGACVATGSFFDDVEGTDAGDDPAGHEPGWTFEVRKNDIPASPTWAVTTDPRSNSLTSSFHSDAAAYGNILDMGKEDLLISPPIEIAFGSELTFWHLCEFRANGLGTIDGGVLEVCDTSNDCSSDANWQDILAAGGTFNQAGYNGAVVAGAGSTIEGRQAWTGVCEFIDVQSQVSVDLGAFSTKTMQFRWRMVLGDFGCLGCTDSGWYIDDVQIDKTGCNLLPVATDDEASTDEDTPVVIDVLANDFDPDGDPLQIDFATDPPNGTVTVNDNDPAPDTVTYTPDIGFTGQDSFAYAVLDPDGGSATASVFVDVGAADRDGDDVPDDVDNCPDTPNAGQGDGDGDGAGDVCDNCTAVANASQCDFDGDGYGNQCDGDFNQDLFTNQSDLGMFRAEFRNPSPGSVADHNCDGFVNQIDLGIFRGLFRNPPGPSALAP